MGASRLPLGILFALLKYPILIMAAFVAVALVVVIGVLS